MAGDLPMGEACQSKVEDSHCVDFLDREKFSDGLPCAFWIIRSSDHPHDFFLPRRCEEVRVNQAKSALRHLAFGEGIRGLFPWGHSPRL
jgi:hypothetical protein